VVVAIGERLVLLEVLAGPCTFAGVFRKLLSGYAFESVGLDRLYGTRDAPAVAGASSRQWRSPRTNNTWR